MTKRFGIVAQGPRLIWDDEATEEFGMQAAELATTLADFVDKGYAQHVGWKDGCAVYALTAKGKRAHNRGRRAA